MTATSIATVEVTVAGTPVPAEAAARVVSARVASRLGLPTQCELAYATLRGSAAELELFPLGAALQVRAAGDAAALFDGEITCCELAHAPDGSTVIRIRGYDRLHRLRKRQQLRVFTDVTAAGLAERLVADDGLSVAAEDDGPSHPRILQHGHTDFELLTGVAARTGLYPVLAGDTLQLLTLAGHGDPAVLELGSSLLEATVQANLDRAAAEFTALGWDSRSAEPFTEQAGDPRSGRSVGIDPSLGDLGLDGDLVLADLAGTTAAEVAARAQAELDRRSSATVTLRGVAAGDASLRAGSRVSVSGMAAAFTGDYVLTEAVHTVDATGYLTAISTEPPPRPAEAGYSSSITLGVVTHVDDPDGLGRVQVTLPAYGESDGAWLGVLCPGAGDGKGLVVLPDPGDTVLVALPHGPVGGVVLGGLFGGRRPPDTGVDGNAVQRWSLLTKDGQRIIVDDAKHSITVRNRTGSMLRLAPGKLTLHAATDLDIQAPGKTITVKAKAVEFVHEPGSQ